MPDVRLIDANALMKRIEEAYCKDCDSHNGVMCRACAHMDDMDFIEDAPTVDAKLVKRGRWIDIDKTMYAKCSVCGKKHYGCVTPYCNMCGAKMDGGDRSETD